MREPTGGAGTTKPTCPPAYSAHPSRCLAPSTPLPSRGKSSGFAAFNSLGSKSSGQPWNAIGTSRRRIAVMPTDVRSGWVVDGNSPLCPRLQTTATPVGQTL